MQQNLDCCFNNMNFLQQTRDWNEEIAATKELPRNKLPERLLRERAMFKVSFYGFVTFFLYLFSNFIHLF